MVITLRRLIALVLIVLFLPIFIATLVIFRVNATVPQASFYTDTLAELDAYNYLYDQGVPYALEEGNVDLAELDLGLNMTNDDLVGSIERVVPPQWLQENVEDVFNQAVPYITGETDTFEITLELDDRVDAAVDEVQTIIRRSDTYDYIMTEEVPKWIADNEASLLDLPYGLSLSGDQLLTGVQQVVTEEWLKARIDQVLDGVTPYAVGKEESFSITFPVQTRSAVAVEVLRGWMLAAVDSGAYDYLLQDQVLPTIQGAVGTQVDLPLGVSLTEAETATVVGEAISQEWVEARVNDAFDAFGPYITAQTDAFGIAIPIRDRMEAGVDSLVAIVDAKYQAIFDGLPTCTPAQLPGLDLTLDAIPECLPPGVTYQQTKQLLGLDVGDQLQGALISALPESVAFTEADLEGALGQGSLLKDIRRYMREGFTFTDQDLRTLIVEQGGQENLDLFDDVRTTLRDGYTVTEQDLLDQLTPQEAADFDDARGWIDQGRTYLPLVLAVWLLLLAMIGLLGGRNWWSKLGWAGVPLVLAGGIVAASITAGVTYLRTFSDDLISDIGVPATFLPKVIEGRDVFIDTFITPLQIQGFIAAGVGLAMVVAGIYLSRSSGQAAATAEPTETPQTEA